MTDHDSVETLRLRRVAWLAYVMSRAGILCYLYLWPVTDTDISLYYKYAAQGAVGQVYRDFDVEYPPLAYAVMRAAYLAVPSAEADHYVAWYYAIFRGAMLLADAIAFGVLLRLVRNEPADKQLWCMGCVVCATTLMASFVLDRLDAALGLLVLLWLLAWSRSQTAAKWSVLAGMALGLGIAYKVIPVVALPVMLVADVVSHRSWPRRLAGSAAVVVATALPFAIGAASAGSHVFDFLDYHGQRGIQIESLYASVMMIMGFAGAQVSPQHGYGGWNLIGTGGSVLAKLSVVILGLYIALLAGMVLRSQRGQPHRSLATLAIAWGSLAIGGSVIFSKVFSTQYLVWALPLLLLGPLRHMPTERYRAYALCCGIMCALAVMVWPYGYPLLVKDFAVPIQLLVIAKNALCVMLVVWAVQTVRKKENSVP